MNYRSASNTRDLMDTQYQAGAKAAREGLPAKANPYRRGSSKRDSWSLGWLAAQRGEEVAPPPTLPAQYVPNDTPHRRMILRVVDSNPGAMRAGFRKSVESAIEDDILSDPETDYCYLQDLRESIERGDCSVVPDAYRVDSATRTVTVWEVEHTYRLKQGKYWDVFWLLDEFCWELKIIRVDAISGGETLVNTFEDIWRTGRAAKAEADAHA